MTDYTGIVIRHLSNNKHEYVRLKMKAVFALNKYPDIDEARIELADDIQNYLQEGDAYDFSKMPCLFWDMLMGALNDVDYDKVAEYFIRKVTGE